jgi:hypothetical protein
MIANEPKPNPTPATEPTPEKSAKATALAETLLAIGREFAKDLTGPSIDHSDFLYDHEGLPKS